MEAPYHRRGKFEDFKEITFTFSSIQDLEKKLESNLEKIKAWFEGDEFEKGRKLKFAKGGKTMDKRRRKMAQGGLAIHFDDDYTNKAEIENLLMSKTYMRDNENLTDYGSSFYVYADDISPSGVRDAFESIIDEGYDRNVELETFAKGGKTQGYNARLDESLAMRRGSKRTKKQGYKSRRHESEGMERSMGRRKYASVGTMDKGRRKMAHGGKIKDIKVGSFEDLHYFINQINSRLPKKGRGYDYSTYITYDIEDTDDGRVAWETEYYQDYGDGNYDELSRESRVVDSEGQAITAVKKSIIKILDYWRPNVLDVDTSYAKGGKTQGYNARLDESLAMRRGSKRTKKQGYKSRRHESEGMERSMGRRKYASVGTMDKGRRTMKQGGYVRPKNLALSEEHYQQLADAVDKVIDHYGEENIKEYIEANGIAGRYNVQFDATKRIWMDDDNANIEKQGRLGIKHDPDWRTRTRMYTDDHFDSTMKSIFKQRLGIKKFGSGGCTSCGKRGRKMAHGGMHRQGYDDKLDESLAMRRGAGRTKEQGRKDRRDESAGMERSMGRRKYASVGTMDKGRRKMEDGGMVEYLLYGVAEGKPDYMEEILFVDDRPIRMTEKLRDMASAKGFDRLRTSMVNLKIAPDFTKALNFKKGGKTKGRKKVSDFDKLAMKVAARYRAQGMSNEKAMEIGRGTAGKVARQQQAKKRKK